MGRRKAAADAPPKGANGSAAALGFEAKLWLAADKLRNNMDAAEYKHVVLGLIFLKFISDSFEEHRAKLLAGKGEYKGSNPEDADEYRAENIFWVPKEARWPHLQANAKQPTVGKLLDDAMVAIERDNPRLKGVLPKDYARPALDKHRLGELIDLVGTIGLGDAENRAKDILGRVYEYFLTMFASAEGKNGGQFYTPSCVVRCLVEMLAPYKGRIYDPCCGSGGMFVQSEKFVEAHGGKVGDISIYGQESNATTRRLAVMIDRVHRELTDADLAKITSTYHAWRGDKGAGKYADVAGFCKSATTAEIAAHGFVLTPGRYVGAEEVEDDGEPFERKMARLVGELHEQFAESAKLEKAIKANLKGLGYGG